MPTLHKRASAAFLRLVAGALFLAMCAWAGAGLFARLTGARAEAAPVAAEAYPLRGVAIRRERRVYEAPEDAVDGQRLPAGRTGGLGSAVWFSGVDGFEDVGPEVLEALDVPALQALLDRPGSPDRAAVGRLVTGRDWYYAALTGAEGEPPECGRCRLRFEGLGRSVPARLLRTADADGVRLMIFRLTEGGELLRLRRVSALLDGGA